MGEKIIQKKTEIKTQYIKKIDWKKLNRNEKWEGGLKRNI